MTIKFKRRDEKFGRAATWMGLVQFAAIADYWSKRFLYRDEVAQIM
jgi:hypothetical protein